MSGNSEGPAEDNTEPKPRKAKVIPFPAPKTPPAVEKPAANFSESLPDAYRSLMPSVDDLGLRLSYRLIKRLSEIRFSGRLSRRASPLTPAQSRKLAAELWNRYHDVDADQHRTELLLDILDHNPEDIIAMLWLIEVDGVPPSWVIPLHEKVLLRATQRLVREQKAAQKKGKPVKEDALRHYLQARSHLADALHKRGQIAAEIEHRVGILSHTPEPTFHMFVGLALCYLQIGDVPKASAILSHYRGQTEHLTVVWALPLERFLASDLPTATDDIAAARRRNPHIEPYLLGERPVPERVPFEFERGSEDEAEAYADELTDAWKAHPNAQEWLRSERA